MIRGGVAGFGWTGKMVGTDAACVDQSVQQT